MVQVSSYSGDLLEQLQNGPLHRLIEWPNPELPKIVAGVYTIWAEDCLVYVRMGVSLSAEHSVEGRAIGKHTTPPYDSVGN